MKHPTVWWDVFSYLVEILSLDNALEACASLPVERREIKLQLRKHRNMLFYQIENPYLRNIYPARKIENTDMD